MIIIHLVNKLDMDSVYFIDLDMNIYEALFQMMPDFFDSQRQDNVVYNKSKHERSISTFVSHGLLHEIWSK